EHGEEQAALRARPRFVAAARGSPDELPGGALALGADQAAFEDVGLLDLHVLVVGQACTRRHAHQRGDEAARLVDEQGLLLDAGVGGLLPRLMGYVDETRSELAHLAGRVHALRFSPTLTIFMVLVPPDLPIGSPMVSTIRSPDFTTLFSTSTFSASRSNSSRSWPTYFTISGYTSRNSAHL